MSLEYSSSQAQVSVDLLYTIPMKTNSLPTG